MGEDSSRSGPLGREAGAHQQGQANRRRRTHSDRAYDCAVIGTDSCQGAGQPSGAGDQEPAALAGVADVQAVDARRCGGCSCRHGHARADSGNQCERPTTATDFQAPRLAKGYRAAMGQRHERVHASLSEGP